jgi:quercetin dioxygenase-like cupin family protein
MLITAATAPTFTQDGTIAVGYASPSRGAADLSLWRIRLEPGAASPYHAVSREEVFLALDGDAVATLDGVEHRLEPGDCLVVPPEVPFAIAAGSGGFAAVCAMAAGGEATILPDGPTITPPWAA